MLAANGFERGSLTVAETWAMYDTGAWRSNID
jgi:hypothetical protein